MDIDFFNAIYSDKKKVDFLHIKQDDFAHLYASLKALSKEVNTYYAHEDGLIELLIAIRKGVNKFFTSIEDYQYVISNNLASLIQNLSEIKSKYEELFQVYCSPIVKSLISIKDTYHDTNFLIKEVVNHLNVAKNQCIVVRYESSIDSIEGVPIIKASKYLRLGEFYDEVFFIGSPDFFDSRFSQLFLAKQTYFVTYDFFQNKIRSSKRFEQLKKSEQIDTLFQKVSISRGYQGEIASVDFGEIQQEVLSTEEIVLRHEKNANAVKDSEKVDAKLVILNNKYYTFIPLETNVRTIEKDKLAITNQKISNLNIGDWILFRNNSNSDLVIDVANRLLGDEHQKYRRQQNRWKKRLKSVIDNNDMGKVIRILQKKGVKNAKLINIENWLGPNNIRLQKDFNIFLAALKFDEEAIKEIVEAMGVLHSTHLSAGKQITSELVKELTEEKIEEIIEQGYATFTSPLVPGASFNIEAIKEIVDSTVKVSRADTMTIWRD